MENLRYIVQKNDGEVLAYFADLTDAMYFADIRSYINCRLADCMNRSKIIVVYDREEQVDISDHYNGHAEVFHKSAGTKKYLKTLKNLKEGKYDFCY